MTESRPATPTPGRALPPALQPAAELIEQAMIADRRRLRSRLGQLAAGSRDDQALAALTADIQRSCAKARARREGAPTPAFVADLPVLARRDEIARVIAAHQVCVICGETGSGKTTQLPQICLAMGRGAHAMIGHTQPRRIAARAVAQRIADELGTSLGPQGAVGYKVRFGDETSDRTLIKLMTDGILLAEVQQDRDLLAYDTLIIDEAHERSLNIDFLLGYLKQHLPRRPDLKVIITSATIDTRRLSDHFGGPQVCPIVEVSGRTYPVEVRYHRVDEVEQDDFEANEESAVLSAVDELTGPGMPKGDILVFLPGEREIRLTGEHLRKQLSIGQGGRHSGGFEIIPLYARLSPQDQQRVFAPHSGQRIVLATNVAETSLTVPGIRYVIDSGLARISRYSHRTKVQRLPIEAISQASANQRAGRCGRVAAGVCIRLYSQGDFDARPAFTDPEILRTNLASVILQMKALRLGPIEEFPFVEAPDVRMIRDGYDTLAELGAVDEAGELTEIGRRLSRIPTDPRIARMLLAAEEEGALDEVLVIASALSVQDVRDRPLEKQQAADAAHTQFKAEGSDFLTMLNMWEAYREARESLSHARLRGWCRDRFISFNRVREWEETHSQLRAIADELKLRAGTRNRDTKGRALGAGGDAIHRALLAGLLSSVLCKDDTSSAGEYFGPRGLRAQVFPGSGLFKKGAKWLMCAELVHTTKLYARTCAKIDPVWIEKVGAHVVKRTHTDPHFVPETGQVSAWEKVLLFGLVLVPRRRVPYGPVNMVEAREVFIHDALVDGQYEADLPFMRHNARVLEEAHELEAKLRRHDLWAEMNRRFEFFDARVPTDVWNKSTFEHWYRAAVKLDAKLLCMSLADVLAAQIDADPHAYPSDYNLGAATASIEYKLQPGKEEDGLTLVVPIESLGQVDPQRLEWLVPGMLREKVLALLKALPKQHRVQFVGTKGDDGAGMAKLADECGALMSFAKGPLAGALSEAVEVLRSVRVPPEAWPMTGVPDHLRMNVRVVDEQGVKLGESRDVEELKKRLATRARKALAGMARQEFGQEGLTSWSFGELPERYETLRAGSTVVGYPTLLDCADSVTLTLSENAETAARLTRRGVVRLLVLQCKDELSHRLRALPGIEDMYKQYAPIGDAAELKGAIMDLIAEKTFIAGQARIATAEDFDQRVMSQWGRLGQHTIEVGKLVGAVLSARQRLAHKMGTGYPRQWETSVADLREQAAYLLPPGVFRAITLDRLAHMPRYVEAMRLRMDKLREDGTAREVRVLPDVQSAWKRFTGWVAGAHAEAKRLGLEEGSPLPAGPVPASPRAKGALPGTIGKRSRVVIASDAAGWAMQAIGDGTMPPEVEAYRWMVEEYRVSCFAQELGTAQPVSIKRLDEAWARVKATGA